MPYAHYELIRLIALLGFGVLAYQVYRLGRQAEMIIYAGLALLFQPFFKVALGRDLWNVVDVIVAVWLMISIFIKPKNAEQDNLYKDNQRRIKETICRNHQDK